MASPTYVKTQFVVDALSFQAFSPTIKCNNLRFVNSGTETIYIRTDSTDASTQDTLLPGDSENIDAPTRALRDVAWRFEPENTIFWAQSSSGNGTLTVTHIE
jgi:hypothetical protein